MNTFVVVLSLAVAASAGYIGHHIPSGSIGVSKDGAVVAGPAGSVATDNGLHSHGADVRLSGPSGDVRTHGGHVVLHGPGNGHDGDDGGHWDGDNGQWQGDGAWGHGDNGQWHGDGAWGHGHVGVWGGHSAGHVAVVAPVAVGWGHGHSLGWGHHGW